MNGCELGSILKLFWCLLIGCDPIDCALWLLLFKLVSKLTNIYSLSHNVILLKHKSWLLCMLLVLREYLLLIKVAH